MGLKDDVDTSCRADRNIAESGSARELIPAVIRKDCAPAHREWIARRSHVIAKPATVHSTLAEPGHPLEPATLAYFEALFGYDLSSAQLHTGDSAAESAVALSARAYTVGRHIVLARGAYAPATASGRRLLAHELAHVIQQSRDGSAASGADHPSMEDAADRTAARAAGGLQVAVAGSSAVGIARQSMFDQFSAGKYSWTFLQRALTHGRPVTTIVSDINALTSAERDQALKDLTEERTTRNRKLKDLEARQKKQTDASLKAVFDPIIKTEADYIARTDQVIDGIAATIAGSETAASLKSGTVAPTAAQKPLIEAALKPDLRPAAQFQEVLPGDPDPYLAKLRPTTQQLIQTRHQKLAVNKREAEHGDPTKVHALSEMERIGNASKRETDNVYGQYKKGPALKADTKTSRGNLHDLWQNTQNQLKSLGPAGKRDMARDLLFYFMQSAKEISRYQRGPQR